MKRLLLLLLLPLGIGFVQCSKGGSSDDTSDVPPPATDAQLQISVLTEDLYHPWEILWGPDNKIWMTERNGRISQVDPQTGAVKNLLTLTDSRESGEGGLLGMALHPDFTTIPQVFIVYNYQKNGSYTEKVVRYTYNGSTLVEPVVLLDNIAAAQFHNGSRLVFGPDKMLYISTGDAGVTSRSQDPASLNGKILRIHPDGSVPADNPVPNNPMWTLGHRNAQGLVFGNGKLFSSEHGPSTDDEINIIEKGRNYGWPTAVGICDQSSEQAFCTSNNVFQPIHSWSPTIAPCGMDYYNSDLIPQWKNSLILAVLKNSVLLQLKLNASGDKIEEVKEFYKNEYGRLRDVCIAPDGKVYVSTDNGNDRILVISRGNQF
ncbi:MAG TPA: PQQ-dependent sugar dehydrogenase [Sphingobacteriaceae bacterium]